MNINFNYSGMFSGTGNSNNSFSGVSGLYGLLGEYNNIRSGAYFKVAREYFNPKTEDTSKTSKTDKISSSSTSDLNDKLASLKKDESTKAYTAVKEETTELKDVISKLTDTGKESLFVEKEKKVKDETTGEETTVKEIDTDAIHKAVKNYVSAYNDTLKAANDSKNTDIIRNAGYMTKYNKIFSRALEEVGITVNEDNTLSVDEKKLTTAKTENLKSLFNGKNSYADVVSQKADMINTAATNAATSANNFYTSTGSYQKSNLNFNALEWYL